MPSLADTLGGLLKDRVTEVARSSVGPVRIRTQWTPEIVLDPLAPSDAPASEGGGFSKWIGDALKPEVSVEIAGAPYTFAPNGSPEANYFPLLVVGGVVIGGGALVLMVLGVRSLFR